MHNRLAPQLEDTIYRITQEAVANIVKHAAPRTHVHMYVRGEAVELSIRDDGAGFVVEGETNGFGLLGMRERIGLANGTITIESTAGNGTVLRDLSHPPSSLARSRGQAVTAGCVKPAPTSGPECPYRDQ